MIYRDGNVISYSHDVSLVASVSPNAYEIDLALKTNYLSKRGADLLEISKK